MKLSSGNYSNPIRNFERRLAPSYEEREFRNPGLSRMRSGLGSLKHTMPHLKPAVKLADGGDPVGRLYAARRGNTYNPDPFARQVIQAERAAASQFNNPAFHAFPGSTAQFPYADGGEAPPDQGPPPEAGGDDLEELLEANDQDLSGPQEQERQIVIEAMLALEGRHPDPQQAIELFVQTFGKDALKELSSLIKSGPQDQSEEEEDQGEEGGQPEPVAAGGQDVPVDTAPPAPDEGEDQPQMQAGGGLLNGPGSGQSDQIEGTTPSGRPVLLSDGEYVIDAPTVSALGDGSTSAGARRLDAFRKQVREQAYGHDKQAKPMAKGGQAIMVELGV